MQTLRGTNFSSSFSNFLCAVSELPNSTARLYMMLRKRNTPPPPSAAPHHLTPADNQPALLPHHLTPADSSPALLPHHLTPAGDNPPALPPPNPRPMTLRPKAGAGRCYHLTAETQEEPPLQVDERDSRRGAEGSFSVQSEDEERLSKGLQHEYCIIPDDMDTDV